MRLRLRLSDASRKAALVERGEEIEREHTLDVPLADLSVKARAVLADLSQTRDRDAHQMSVGEPYAVLPPPGGGKQYEVDALPQTPAEWESLLVGYAAAQAEYQRQATAATEQSDREYREKVTAIAQAYLAGDTACVGPEEKRLMPKFRLNYSDLALLPPDTADAIRAEDARRVAKQRGAEAEREERKAAEREAAEQERTDWIAAHGSDHLRAASDAGYDCKRLYVTERAALEHPGYVVDFDDNAQWRDRSCPSPDALAEELRVTPMLAQGETVEVVWLITPPHSRVDDEDDEDWEQCEAVVIQEFLGDYDLVRTDLPGSDEGSMEELTGGYQLVGRMLRHADAVMLCNGHTDAQSLTAQHTLVSGPLPEGCPGEGPIPVEMQQEISATGTEGVWFARTFPSAQHANAFAKQRLALSARRQRAQ